MEKVNWKVEGMSCTNCALTIQKHLEQKGLANVKVNFIGGDISFDLNGNDTKPAIAKGIEGLGYHVVSDELAGAAKPPKAFKTTRSDSYCVLCLRPLMLHMIPGCIYMC